MSARDAILGRIGEALGRSARVGLDDRPLEVQHRLDTPSDLTRPAVADKRIELLLENMEAVQMSVVRLQTASDITSAVEWFIQEHGIEGEITVAPSLAQLDWPAHVRTGSASGVEKTSVTNCLAAIAETGSVALASSAESPATLNFLPDNHVVVVHESQVVDQLEDVFALMRALPEQPRALNLVTGPSRTGDIEQTIEIGAHGPRRMHVLLVSGD